LYIKLGIQDSDLQFAKQRRHAILRGWFGGNPTKVFKCGKIQSFLPELPPHQEGMVVICKGNAKNIKWILDNSWWGRGWKNYEIFRELILVVHQDEALDYYEELKNVMTRTIYIVSHSAAGSGPVRNSIKLYSLLVESYLSISHLFMV